MKSSTAPPLTEEQYCHTPTCPSGLPFVPPIDQWVSATCALPGKGWPSSEVQGAAMNLSLWSVPVNFFEIERRSAISVSSSATVLSYQRIVWPCSRLCTSRSSGGRSSVV